MSTMENGAGRYQASRWCQSSPSPITHHSALQPPRKYLSGLVPLKRWLQGQGHWRRKWKRAAPTLSLRWKAAKGRASVGPALPTAIFTDERAVAGDGVALSTGSPKKLLLKSQNQGTENFRGKMVELRLRSKRLLRHCFWYLKTVFQSSIVKTDFPTAKQNKANKQKPQKQAWSGVPGKEACTGDSSCCSGLPTVSCLTCHGLWASVPSSENRGSHRDGKSPPSPSAEARCAASSGQR